MTPDKLVVLWREAQECAAEAERLSAGDAAEQLRATQMAAMASERVAQARALASRLIADLRSAQRQAEDAAAAVMRARQAREDAEARPRALGLRPAGECAQCDRIHERGEDFFPRHDPSPRCRSGKVPHCTCDTCF